MKIVGKYTNCDIFAKTLEDGIYSQVYDIINSKAFAGKKVCLMPDAHIGASGPCGLVAQIGDYVCPEHVGVDVGCEISALFLNKKINESDYKLLEHRLVEAIPMGFEIHKSTVIDEKDFRKFMGSWFTKFKSLQPDLLDNLPNSVTEKWISSVLKRIGMEEEKFWHSIGTVGGGNHYIEYDEDNDGHQALTFHFGSRNFGLKICNYWTKIAKSNKIDKNYIKQITAEFKAKYDGPKKDIKEKLNAYIEEHAPNTINGYLSGEAMKGYLCDMVFAMGYARYNHLTVEKIAANIISKFGIKVTNRVSTTHNYIDFRDFTLRKSAISANKGEIVLIPFNMRDGIAVCEGIGNSDWLNSCSHGAGRKMSRSAAKKNISLDDFKKSMEGIYTTTANITTIDEAPMAYKDTEEIKSLITDTVDIKYCMQPKINIKAAE